MAELSKLETICLQDLIWVGLVSTAYAFRLTWFGREVGKSRTKYKVAPPEMSGPPEFIRIVRAHANSVEWAPSFFAVLWGAGIFFHQVPAAILGSLYVYQRHRYFYDYQEEADKRLKPFKRSIYLFLGLTTMSVAGLATMILRQYTGVDLKTIILSPVLSWIYPNTSV